MKHFSKIVLASLALSGSAQAQWFDADPFEMFEEMHRAMEKTWRRATKNTRSLRTKNACNWQADFNKQNDSYVVRIKLPEGTSIDDITVTLDRSRQKKPHLEVEIQHHEETRGYDDKVCSSSVSYQAFTVPLPETTRLDAQQDVTLDGSTLTVTVPVNGRPVKFEPRKQLTIRGLAEEPALRQAAMQECEAHTDDNTILDATTPEVK